MKYNHIEECFKKELEDPVVEQLNPNLFPRVNRSAMINLSKLKRLTPNSNGEYLAQLTSGDSVKVSRKYKFKLEELRKNSVS